jgi:signal transduction histidine kinase/CheY-like chemotaxis protein
MTPRIQDLEPAADRPEDGAAKESAATPLQLLVVDDDSVDRLAVRRALAVGELRAEIEEADTAAAAIARLRAGGFDCAVLDYHLPGGDGLLVLRQVREANVGTPIIVLTGRGDEQIAVELMKAGAADYISKQALSPERLAQSVRNAVRLRQAELQAAAAAGALSRYVAQLRALADAALAITSAHELGAMLDEITERARTIVGAHQGMVTLSAPAHRPPPAQTSSVSLSDKYAEFRSLVITPDPFGIASLVRQTIRPVRLTQEELEALPAWRPVSDQDDATLPHRGWLAAPLFSRSGDGIGVIHLSDRAEGDFTAEDEAVLVQLGRLASVAIENLRLYDTAQLAIRAREQVLAMVSHDLRNPLNTIVMGVTLLLETPLPQDQVTRQLAAVRRASDAMNRMIQDLLDVTRVEAGRLAIDAAPMDVTPVLHEACEMLEPLASERTIELRCLAPERLPTIEADRDRLLQVLSNLIGNAIKFTGPGGRVTLDGRPVDNGVEIAVEDTGPGIRPEHLTRIFEPFWQLEQAGRLGAGLGLPIAKAIVEAHGGTMRVDSNPGRGTTFYFTIPASAAARPNDQK